MDKNDKNSATVAKSDDGTIQITFKIPYADIKKAKDQALVEIGKETEIPGFRKGMAPIDKLIAHVPENNLIEKTLSKVLPKLIGAVIDEHKIKPVVYPRFELISAKENEDWQIRAVTCEIPAFDLGDYKKAVTGALRAKAIWTPGKDEKKKEELTHEQKEQEVIKILLETVKIKIPSILIEEETNSRLSALIEKIEKLGLSLESYLASIGKTPQTLRSGYENDSRQSISIDLILNKIAEVENIKVEPKFVDDAVKAASSDPKVLERINTPEQRKLIESILRRKLALDSLTSLV